MKTIEKTNTSGGKSEGMTSERQKRMSQSDIAALREERRKEREDDEKRREKREKKYLRQNLLVLISILSPVYRLESQSVP